MLSERKKINNRSYHTTLAYKVRKKSVWNWQKRNTKQLGFDDGDKDKSLVKKAAVDCSIRKSRCTWSKGQGFFIKMEYLSLGGFVDLEALHESQGIGMRL